MICTQRKKYFNYLNNNNSLNRAFYLLFVICFDNSLEFFVSLGILRLPIDALFV